MKAFERQSGQLTKMDVEQFISSIEYELHYVFALWAQAPIDLFSIKHETSASAAKKVVNISKHSDNYSLSDFMEHYATFTDDDRFAVIFNTVPLLEKEDFKTDVILMIYKYVLHYHCEKAIYDNNSIILRDDVAARYGLTDSDKKTVRGILFSLNNEIIEDLQKDYDILKNLVCIKK